MDQHVAITESLQARDGCQAEALLQKHISDFQNEIRAVL
jgi:DNA-binding GntR family transcriptional regulator